VHDNFSVNTINIAGMNIFLEHNAIILDIEVGIVDPIDIYSVAFIYKKSRDLLMKSRA